MAGAPLFRVRTLISGSSGGSGLSTMYFDATGPLTAANAATAVHVFWDSIKAQISNNLLFSQDPLVYTIDPASGAPTAVTTAVNTAVAGTNVSDEEPWATQGLITWNTGNFIGGREVKGRTFVPGPTSTLSSGGAPAAAYLTALNTAAATLIATANADLCIYSRKLGEGIQVTAGGAWSKWAVLTSRRD